MAKPSKEEMEKVILTAIVGVAVMVSIYMFLVSPQLQQLRGFKKEIQEQQDKLDNARKLIKNAKKRKASIAKLTKEISSADLVLPKESGYSWFLELINLWGSSQSVKFDTIVPKETNDGVNMSVSGKKYYSMDMEIALRGGYHEIGRLVNKMENYSDTIYIKDISIESEDGSDGQILKARLTVNLFVLQAAG